MATNVEKWAPGDPVPYNYGKDLTRHDFPEGFLFGGATSSYQVEGAYDKDRRGICNWDDWSLMRPGKVADGGNGTLAIDHYNRVKAGSEWLYIVPIGIYDLLTYAKRKYNDPAIYITENGASEKNVKNLPVHLLLNDDYRIKYHQQHLAYIKLAIDTAKVNVKGYVVWSILDNYEWAAGYTVRFGMYFVDYLNGLNRYPKKSAIWYMNFLNKKKLPGPKDREVEEISENETQGKKKRKY
ncbi:beta-glucosidase [Striga asiatica]|uniref:Beta-glucosidase n=1 Tax=Striga asiatica TaxID=4170 RepID=A0A5A7QBM1_STRAF|nr:beta-glucosidase [Striga asiatica]